MNEKENKRKKPVEERSRCVYFTFHTFMLLPNLLFCMYVARLARSTMATFICVQGKTCLMLFFFLKQNRFVEIFSRLIHSLCNRPFKGCFSVFFLKCPGKDGKI